MQRIALEAGAQSAWISRDLNRLGHEVIVPNPRELKWITIERAIAISRARTLLINSARSIAKGFGVHLPKSITNTFGERAVEALPEFPCTALSGLLKQIDAISREIIGYDQEISELAGQHPELARLESIPSVGRLTAMMFELPVGRAERFGHSRDVVGFLGLRPKHARAARAIRSWDFQKRRS